jgi:hypothetical protein
MQWSHSQDHSGALGSRGCWSEHFCTAAAIVCGSPMTTVYTGPGGGGGRGGKNEGRGGRGGQLGHAGRLGEGGLGGGCGRGGGRGGGGGATAGDRWPVTSRLALAFTVLLRLTQDDTSSQRSALHCHRCIATICIATGHRPHSHVVNSLRGQLVGSPPGYTTRDALAPTGTRGLPL